MKRLIIILLLIPLLTSCFSVNISEPEEVFEYWLGIDPPQEVQLMKGQYYQSPHFTLEYELFLKFKAETSWFNELVTYNRLELDTVSNNWVGLTKLPVWFEIDKEYLIYNQNQNRAFEQSRYFFNPKNGMCYIYESVGM